MTPARKLQVLRQEDFDRLLLWLDPDPERAGIIYEKIRWRMIAILASRGCRLAEELADETIDRVARRVADIQAKYVDERAIYFLGVMNKSEYSAPACVAHQGEIANVHQEMSGSVSRISFWKKAGARDFGEREVMLNKQLSPAFS